MTEIQIRELSADVYAALQKTLGAGFPYVLVVAHGTTLEVVTNAKPPSVVSKVLEQAAEMTREPGERLLVS